MATQLDAIGGSQGEGAVPQSNAATSASGRQGVRAGRRILIALIAVWASSLTLLTALDLDIASHRYLRNDLLLRGAESIDSFYRQPVMDPSPHSIALPADLFVKRSLWRGELPIWDRSQGGGYSPLAQGNLGMLFPVRWFAALFPDAQVQSVVLLTTLFACLAFSVMAIRTLGMGVQAACLGALVYSLSGFMIGQLLFDGVAVYLFLPWLVYAYLNFCEVRTPARFAHLAVAFGLSFTSGHLMLLACVFFGVAVLAVFHSAMGEESNQRKLRDLASLGAASVWGALLAAPFLLPFVQNFRAAWKYKTQTAEGVSYEVSDLAGWFARLRAVGLDEAGPFMDGPGFYLYLGLPVLALAGVGAYACWRRPHLRFVAVLLAFMFVVCVPGPWMAFAAHVPPITFIRTLYLYALFVFAVSLAAAAGIDWIRNHPSVPRAEAVCWAVVVLFAGTFLARGSEHFAPVSGADLSQSKPLTVLVSDPEPHRVTGLWGQLHLPNISHLSGVEDLRLLAVTLNTRYHEWFEIVDPAILGKNFPTARITEQVSSPLLGAFNVKYVLEGKLPHHYFVTQLTPGDPFGVFDPRAIQMSEDNLTPRYEDGLLRIHQVTNTYQPRAYFPTAVAVVQYGAANASSWLRENPEQHGEAVVVEVSNAALAKRIQEEGQNGPAPTSRVVNIHYPSDSAVELDVEAASPGLLVLNDIYEAGWSAEIDGTPSEILPTNLISRGVWLDAGKHSVVMSYWPPGLTPGLWLAAVSLAALAALCAWPLGVEGGSKASSGPVSSPQLPV